MASWPTNTANTNFAEFENCSTHRRRSLPKWNRMTIHQKRRQHSESNVALTVKLGCCGQLTSHRVPDFRKCLTFRCSSPRDVMKSPTIPTQSHSSKDGFTKRFPARREPVRLHREKVSESNDALAVPPSFHAHHSAFDPNGPVGISYQTPATLGRTPNQST